MGMTQLSREPNLHAAPAHAWSHTGSRACHHGGADAHIGMSTNGVCVLGAAACLRAVSCMQEIEEAVNQAIKEAGLPPTADSLDYTAFMRLLMADMSPSLSPHTMTKFPSMAQADPWSVPSFSGMLKRACSTTLRRRSSTNMSRALAGTASTDDNTVADAPPLRDVVTGALQEEMACVLPQGRQVRARSRMGSACVPCMDQSIAHAGLQPVAEEDGRAGLRAGVAASAGDGGGGNAPAPMPETGGGGDGGRGGGRREIAGDHAWEGDEDDHVARRGWDMSRLSQDRIRNLFPASPARTPAHLDSVAEGGNDSSASGGEQGTRHMTAAHSMT